MKLWECAKLFALCVRRGAALVYSRPLKGREQIRSQRALLALFLSLLAPAAIAQDVVVASKKFPESNILGAMATKLINDAGVPATQKADMGATGIVWEALKGGGITMYPEYTGTLWQDILKLEKKPSMADLRAAVGKFGIGVSDPLGYNNGYVIVMREDKAERLGIRKISDLANHPELKAGIDPEYLGRKDGWKPLSQTYGLHFDSVRSIDHGLVYAAVDRGDLDLTDGYGTDAEIIDYKLRVLEDDKSYFPTYYAIFLYRLDAPKAALDAMRKLENKINDQQMREMNVAVRKSGDHKAVASKFLLDQHITAVPPKPEDEETTTSRVIGYTLVHLKLVGISLLIAVLIGLPLGIVASRPGVVSTVILSVVGMIQTIPSLALLGLLVPIAFLGISMWTAVVALILYSLLPIVRNTATGIQNIAPPIRESAEALGLEPSAQLTKVFLPIASRTILAGIKTAAVINVGTAALAALIGAGGLGEPMVNGLSRNDTGTILLGAPPSRCSSNCFSRVWIAS
jgi:osmoprotectant transport system permease protein